MKHEQWRILREETHFKEMEERDCAAYLKYAQLAMGRKKKWDSSEDVIYVLLRDKDRELNWGNAWIYRPFVSSLSCGVSEKF